MALSVDRESYQIGSRELHMLSYTVPLRIESACPVCSPEWQSPHCSAPMHWSGQEGYAFASLVAFALCVPFALFVYGWTCWGIIYYSYTTGGSAPKHP